MNADQTGQEPTVVSPAALAETAIAGTVPTAWSDADHITEPEPYDIPDRRNWLITGVLFAALAAIAAIVGAGAFAYLGSNGSPAPAAQSPVAPKDEPTEPLDRDFMSRLTQSHIPADDWRYYTTLARSVCETAQQEWAPGEFGFDIARKFIATKEPKWTQSQIHGFTAMIYETYCPKMWGPTGDELAAMAPDDRLIALLGSRAGLIAASPEQVQSAIAASRNTCRKLGSGQSRTSVIDDVKAGNRDWTYETARTAVGVSVEVLCPQYG
ncbi:DUF732 domain-containing protein [Mycobacteroides abscessus]|uniref:DUF732 domain-containing protein n=1 Tax=Mycobacteroides abscessus TaxID=36809 RepID=UPI0009A7B71D|nr:DUF732 domain-containing protein [Mycobacteroides abscessus]SLC02362.1 Protein of uncharacterised function (DUF732) [Mycobacteroides abscessus subsp. abscessus]SLG08425.1 Protein of uncharacterised function (DUF732) [Mycobacteroides abscessus subsp. abscessus]